MHPDELDYPLDPTLIAQYPAPKRDQSRLMVLDRTTGKRAHRIFSDIQTLLQPGDLLVLNNTRVRPARLRGRKKPTGGQVEVLLLRPLEADRWLALVRGRVRAGTRIHFSPDLEGTLLEGGQGTWQIQLEASGPLSAILSRVGEIPLPPYIRRSPTPEDRERYQTVYAQEEGAVAAPTAGLHFTQALLDALQARGIRLAWITLHVGPGTFRPVQDGRPVEAHPLDPEWYILPLETVQAIQETRLRGGRVVAVGTTVVRTLEGVVQERGHLEAASGWTRLLITPGFRFQLIDALLTNFHLPRTSLLALVMAFAGREAILEAYREAQALRYRFYSYGDAMLIL